MTRRNLSTKVFVDAAEKAAAEGKAPDEALREASEAAYGEVKNLPAVVRRELGIDDPEVSETFMGMIVEDYKRVKSGQFPAYIEAVLDPAVKAKLCLEYEKHKENKLADAFIVKTERRINNDGDLTMKTDEELEYFRVHGRWPKTLDGSSSVN